MRKVADRSNAASWFRVMSRTAAPMRPDVSSSDHLGLGFRAGVRMTAACIERASA